jgi:DNA-binding response OmpR family regulator
MNMKILIVDDTPDLLESLKEFFDMEGFAVNTAVNGQDALDKLMKEKPQLIITDLLMPVMDGFTFIENLKRIEDYKDIPVIIFSAKPQKESEERAHGLGADRFVVKPSSLDVILKSVNELVHS